MKRWERYTLPPLLVLTTVAAIAAAFSFREAHRDPVVVRYDIESPRLSGASLRIAVASDTHVAESVGTALDPSRLEQHVAAINELRPDIIILAGDYIATPPGGSLPFREAIAPFARLKARLGVYAVIGNHDYERGDSAKSLADALKRIGVRPLVNQTADLGPVVLGGLDDLWNGSPDMATAARALDQAAGRPIILASHNPDVFPEVPRDVELTVAGHTHGGQVVPPLVGPIISVSRYGHRYRYGLISERGHQLLVTSGLGGLALRMGVPPEIALVTLRPSSTKTQANP